MKNISSSLVATDIFVLLVLDVWVCSVWLRCIGATDALVQNGGVSGWCRACRDGGMQDTVSGRCCGCKVVELGRWAGDWGGGRKCGSGGASDVMIAE